MIAKRLEEPSDAGGVIAGPAEKVAVAVVVEADAFSIRASAFFLNVIDL